MINLSGTITHNVNVKTPEADVFDNTVDGGGGSVTVNDAANHSFYKTGNTKLIWKDSNGGRFVNRVAQDTPFVFELEAGSVTIDGGSVPEIRVTGLDTTLIINTQVAKLDVKTGASVEISAQNSNAVEQITAADPGSVTVAQDTGFNEDAVGKAEAAAFKADVEKVTLKDSTVRDDSFRLGINWSEVSSEIKDQPVNEIFNTFKVTLLDNSNKVIASLDMALDNNPAEDGFINKMNVSKVDATSIRYDSTGVKAKTGVTGWNKSAYVGGKDNQPKIAILELEDKNGYKISKEVKINE